VLTYLGYKDTPAHSRSGTLDADGAAGREFVADPQCRACHTQGGAANPIANTRVTRDQEWLLAHVRDPEIIAPGCGRFRRAR
jgi:mono/diheme cytochrome c family protein